MQLCIKLIPTIILFLPMSELHNVGLVLTATATTAHKRRSDCPLDPPSIMHSQPSSITYTSTNKTANYHLGLFATCVCIFWSTVCSKMLHIFSKCRHQDVEDMKV